MCNESSLNISVKVVRGQVKPLSVKPVSVLGVRSPAAVGVNLLCVCLVVKHVCAMRAA